MSFWGVGNYAHDLKPLVGLLPQPNQGNIDHTVCSDIVS